MKQTILGSFFLISLSYAAHAETFMFSYGAVLSKSDAYNSRGMPLEGWCSIFQQDRANWHKFNKHDRYDEPDPYFNTPEKRATMVGKCEVTGGVFPDPGNQIRSGNRELDLTIQVFGTGGQIKKIRFTDRF